MTAPTPEDVPHAPAYGAQPYDPAYGYGPPGVPQYPNPHPGPTQSNDVTMAVLAYALGIAASWLGPLIIYLVKKNDSRFVRYHAAQALNAYLTYMIMVFGTMIPLVILTIAANAPYPMLIGIPLYLALWISHLVFTIIGLIHASRGELYRFPTILAFRMVH